MKVERPYEDVIVFRGSKRGAFIFVIVLLSLIAGWEWVIWMKLALCEKSPLLALVPKDYHRLLFRVLAGLPVVFAPSLVRQSRAVLFGQTIVFDRLSRTIRKNNRLLANFDEVLRYDFESIGREYVITRLFLSTGKTVEVGNLKDSEELEKIRSDFERFFENVAVVHKKDTPSDLKGLNKLLSLTYYGMRATGILLMLCGTLLPLLKIMPISEKLKIGGSTWEESIFLIFFGVVIYGVSVVFKYLPFVIEK